MSTPGSRARALRSSGIPSAGANPHEHFEFFLADEIWKERSFVFGTGEGGFWGGWGLGGCGGGGVWGVGVGLLGGWWVWVWGGVGWGWGVRGVGGWGGFGWGGGGGGLLLGGGVGGWWVGVGGFVGCWGVWVGVGGGVVFGNGLLRFHRHLDSGG